MSVFAAASNTENFESSGEKAYKISAAFQAPTLKVTVPTAMNAVLNPYKIVITTETGDTGTDGVTSPEYTISNNDTTFGIKVAAKATASGLDKIVASADDVNVTDASGNQLKNAYIVLRATPVDDGNGKGDYSDVDNTDLDKASELVFAEEMETAVKLMQLTKAVDASTPTKGFVQIGGEIPTEPTEKWATSDKLALNVVFDINPYNPDAAGGGSNPTPAAPDVAIDSGSSTFNGVSLSGTTFTVDSNLSDGAGDTADMTLYDENGDVIKKTGTNVTVTIKTDNDSILSINNAGKITISTTGTPGTYTATITLTDTVNSKTQDYTITMTEVA